MTMKKKYTIPQIEEIQMSPVALIALSGGEQTETDVFTGKEIDAGNALSNRRRGW